MRSKSCRGIASSSQCSTRTAGPWRLVAVAVFLTLGCTRLQAERSAYDWALLRLDYGRQERADELRRFCGRAHALARGAVSDPSVHSFFAINLKYARARESGSVPAELDAKVEELRQRFDQYYIETYFTFYDILFIDPGCRVFYTMRKESDLATTLLQTDSGSISGLAECLAARPTSEVFVDFHEYGPSGEPAAFFVEPISVSPEEGVEGWLALQCAVNKINGIFAWTETLGRTGETFLVNAAGYMLTESNFDGSSTILRRQLDDRNVQAKFAEGAGHRTVTDYRGHVALSSFEVVDFLTTRWLAVAKLDRDEVDTEQYLQHRRYYGERLLEQLADRPASEPAAYPHPPGSDASLRADMDEFVRAADGEAVHTFGISTCTGLLAAFPERFAYLAHISPRDKVYGSDATNLVGQMLKRIQSFDIYPSEQRRVRFAVVAPHLDSVLAVTDKILEEGFLLSQIQVFCDPTAAVGAVHYAYDRDETRVVWRYADGSATVQSPDSAVNLGLLMARAMGKEP